MLTTFFCVRINIYFCLNPYYSGIIQNLKNSQLQYQRIEKGTH